MKKKITFALFFAAFGAVVYSCNDDSASGVENTCLPNVLQDGLIASYSFGSGSLNDGVGSAHLTASNAQPAEDRAGNLTCAYAFTGQQDSYLITQNTAFLNGLGEMSVSFWYKPTGYQNGFEVLVGRGDGLHCPDTNGQWSVGLYDCRRAVFGHGNSIWDAIDSEEFNCSDLIAGSVGAWYYVTATYNQVNNELKLYKNGQFQEADTGFADCDGNGSTFIPADTGDLIIGKGFTGIIDDVAIYNKVLTQAEITQLYNLEACCE